MSVGSYIAALLASEKLGGQVTCHRLLPAADPQYAQTRLPWPTAISRILEQRGIAGLYSHQALATDHIRAGHSIVAATPTASGKSLIYNLPVLERHLRDPDARALYLFPLKALAQDQLAAFNALTATWPKDARPAAALYDGDTTDHFRRKIRRDPPAVLISNPEMLHLGILPHHDQWAAFLAGRSYPCGGGRGPYLPGRVRRAYGPGLPAAQPAGRTLRRKARLCAVHRHSGQPRRTGGRAHRHGISLCEREHCVRRRRQQHRQRLRQRHSL